MRRRRSRVLALGAMSATVAMLTAGCLQGGDDGGGGGDGGGSAGGTEAGDDVVTIFGSPSGAEGENFEASLKPFEDETGIDIEYTSSSDFTTFIRSRVRGGETPDIALFPQPGLLLDIADGGDLVPIDDAVDIGALEESLIPGFLDSATGEDGEIYGAPMKMAVKSLVFVPKAYSEAGYSTEPASLQELADIAEEIKTKEGVAPWCIGIEDGPSTGWVGTDWVEEMMLRLHGPEVYDQWVNHEIPFDDPKVQEAFEAFGDIALTEGNVAGGSQGILNTPFGEASTPAFKNPPGCYLQRQGDFITAFFPEDVQSNLDDAVDVFPFPPMEGGYDGQPMLGAGDLAALFNGEDEQAAQVLEFITSPEFGGEWAKAGGWLSPHTTFDSSQYGSELTRQVAEIAASADVFRYDASDLMPAEVGAGTFWTGMVEFIQGTPAEEVTANIEGSWPSG